MANINFLPNCKRITAYLINKFISIPKKINFSLAIPVLKNIPLWVYLLVLTILFFMPVKHVYFNEDGLEYLGQALNVYKGRGLVNMDQTTPMSTRLLFPLYMAIIFHIFEPTNMIAYIFVRIFYVFEILMIYFLGKKLFNQWVGLLTSLLVLTSFSINEWSTIVNIDFIPPFFLLISMLTIVNAFETSKYRWFILAGLCIGASFLIKETSIVAVIIPILLWLLVRQYRNRQNLWGVAIFLLVVTITLVGWFYYAQMAAIRSNLLLGNQGKDTSQTIASAFGSSNLSSTLISLITSPYSYYKNQIAPNFFFGPLFIIAWGYIAITAWRGKSKQNQSNLMLCIFLVPFIPQVVYQGMYGFRATQGVFVFFLCYLALGKFLWDVSEALRKRWGKMTFKTKYSLRIDVFLQIAVIIGVLTAQSLEHQIDFEGRPRIEIVRVGRGSMLDHWERFNTITYLESDKKWITNMQVSDQVGQWLDQYVPVGTPLMMTSALGRLINWSSESNYPIYFFPYVQSTLTYNSISLETQVAKQSVLFVQNLGNYQRVAEIAPEYSIWSALTEENLIEVIQLHSIKYILTGQNGFEVSYFIQNPGYVLVADFGSIQVFKVVSTESRVDNFSIHLVGSAYKDLNRYYTLNPEGFKRFETGFITGILGISDENLTQLLAGNMPSITLEYSLRMYLDNLINFGTDQLKNLESIQKQNSLVEPNNPWPFVLLGRIYQALGNPDQAIQAYRQALSLYNSNDSSLQDWAYVAKYINFIKPENQIEYFTLGPAYRSDDSGLQGVSGKYMIMDLQDAFSIDTSSIVYNTSFIIDGIPHGILFMPPGNSREFTIKLPEMSELIFGLAIAPEVWDNASMDGVLFEIFLEEGNTKYQIFGEYVNPNQFPVQRHWLDRTVDLSYWGGREIKLSLVTSPGPNNDPNFDWAGWGEPRLIIPVQYDFLDDFAQAQTELSEPKKLRVDQMEVGYETRSIIFAHPDSSVTYNITLPENPALLFGIGMDPAVWDPQKGDGVEYIIDVALPDEPDRVYRVYSRYIDPKNNPDDRRWFDERVDLSAFDGKQVRLSFQTRPGPAGDYDFDWAGWSRPVLVDGIGSVMSSDVPQP